MTMSVELQRNNDAPQCHKCMVSLMGRQYLIQKSQKFCVECYESLFCNTCHTCGKIIATGMRDLSYKEYHFHESCFACDGCDKSLSGERFIHKDGKFICGPCYENKFSPKCAACKRSFKPGVKRMEYNGANFHEECFCCSSCGDAIGKKSFMERDNGYYCEKCFEAHIATKCAKCRKIIKSSGVSYRDQTYHSSCLRCGGCDKELAGLQLVSHDDQPYCIECHTDKFAQKCLTCGRAISGLGETKMIAFEDFHWHLGCFRCASCNISLEGEGFIMEEGDTYCQACAEEL